MLVLGTQIALKVHALGSLDRWKIILAAVIFKAQFHGSGDCGLLLGWFQNLWLVLHN